MLGFDKGVDIYRVREVGVVGKGKKGGGWSSLLSTGSRRGEGVRGVVMGLGLVCLVG